MINKFFLVATLYSCSIFGMELQQDPNYAHLKVYCLPSSQVLTTSFDANNLKKFREQQSLFIEKIADQEANFMDVYGLLRHYIMQYNRQDDQKPEDQKDPIYGLSLFANRVAILKIIFQNHETALLSIEIAKGLGNFKK